MSGPSDRLCGPPPHLDGEVARSAGGVSPRRYRHQLTLPEAMLWVRLRQRPDGLKFRKQHPAGRYRLDFFCAERSLVVEIDGESHDRGDRPARDVRRDAWCRAQGMTVLRIPASDVLRDADAAADAIVRYAVALPVVFSAPTRSRRAPPSASPPPPQPDGEEQNNPPHLDGEVARSAGGAATTTKQKDHA